MLLDALSLGPKLVHYTITVDVFIYVIPFLFSFVILLFVMINYLILDPKFV
jgi:hypothetical protein